ncbi:unnamed protein product [Calypogeia fissa]
MISRGNHQQREKKHERHGKIIWELQISIIVRKQGNMADMKAFVSHGSLGRKEGNLIDFGPRHLEHRHFIEFYDLHTS